MLQAIKETRTNRYLMEEHELLRRLDEKQEKEIESFHLTEALSHLIHLIKRLLSYFTTMIVHSGYFGRDGKTSWYSKNVPT